MSKLNRIIDDIRSFKGSGMPSSFMKDFEPGTLTSHLVANLAEETGGFYFEDMTWLAHNCRFFQFVANDGLPLQAYHIRPIKSDSTKPAIIFCAGWTETSLKYSNIFRFLFNEGYHVFSFDLRGQGYSCPMGFDKGPISITEDFYDYVKDLELFVKQELHYDESIIADEIVYIGTSLATVIGLLALKRNPDMFCKMILLAPAIRPPINAFLRFLLVLLRFIGLGSFLLTRFTDSIEKIVVTNEWENRAAYLRLRKLSPITQTQGPTISWVVELVKAGNEAMAYAEKYKTEMLIIQGDLDTHVDRNVIISFFGKIGTHSRMLRLVNCYHEILQENELILKVVYTEIDHFISKKECF